MTPRSTLADLFERLKGKEIVGDWQMVPGSGCVVITPGRADPETPPDGWPPGAYLDGPFVRIRPPSDPAEWDRLRERLAALMIELGVTDRPPDTPHVVEAP